MTRRPLLAGNVRGRVVRSFDPSRCGPPEPSHVMIPLRMQRQSPAPSIHRSDESVVSQPASFRLALWLVHHQGFTVPRMFGWIFFCSSRMHSRCSQGFSPCYFRTCCGGVSFLRSTVCMVGFLPGGSFPTAVGCRRRSRTSPRNFGSPVGRLRSPCFTATLGQVRKARLVPRLDGPFDRAAMVVAISNVAVGWAIPWTVLVRSLPSPPTAPRCFPSFHRSIRDAIAAI